MQIENEQERIALSESLVGLFGLTGIGVLEKTVERLTKTDNLSIFLVI
jgi:hypothetical protein